MERVRITDEDTATAARVRISPEEEAAEEDFAELMDMLDIDEMGIPQFTTGRGLKPKIIVELCKLIIRGLPMDGCCDYLGIGPTQFWEWTQRGKKYLEGNNEPAEWEIYGQFVTAIQRALATYRLRVIDDLHLATAMSWTKFMTILERRDRKNFGRNDPYASAEEDFEPDERFL